MKATSIFGGVQVFNILILLIRSKVIAVLLGTAGMGIMGLLSTTVSLIASATNFGLGMSAVRDVSEASACKNSKRISETVAVLRKLVWITGGLGLALTLILSPVLSKTTFGNDDYIWAFAVLSVTLLINQLSSGNSVLLQGMRKIKWLAQANVLGATFSLLLSLPLYYLWGCKGIVPAMVLTSIVAFILQYYYSKKIKIDRTFISVADSLKRGKIMLKLGFMLSLSGLIVVAASYLIRIFIANTGGVEDVGLYNAGFAIINVYVGLVFSAMATDYYPRLTAANSKVKEYNELINLQSEVSLYLLSPLICIFIVFVNWMVVLLYSDKFLPVTEMIHWAILGVYFKSLSWAVALLFLAKGDSKAFFGNELLANSYTLLLNAVGYHLGGLTGLGLSFLFGYIVYFLQVSLVCKMKYGFKWGRGVFKLFLFNVVFGATCFIVYLTLEGWLFYAIGTILILALSTFSIFRLNKKTGAVGFLSSRFKNIDKKNK